MYVTWGADPVRAVAGIGHFESWSSDRVGLVVDLTRHGDQVVAKGHFESWSRRCSVRRIEFTATATGEGLP